MAGTSRLADHRWLPLVVVIIGSFMSILDGTVVNVALPRIMTEFGTGVSEGQWVLSVYMLALAVVIPASGYASDLLGTKTIYVYSLIAFTLGSMLCGLAWNVESLIFFRAIQGLGGGMLMPVGMAIIMHTVPASQRGKAMGFLGLPMLVAPAIGPTLSGYIVQFLTWRIIFYLNVPIGIVGTILALRILRNGPRQTVHKFDWVGLSLSTIGFSALLYGLSLGSTDGWTDPVILTCLIVGPLALVAFVFNELRHSDPVMDLTLFKNGAFSIAMVLSFITTFCMFGAIFLLPLFLQEVRGFSPLETGLILLPQGLTAALVMPISGALFDRVGARPLVVAGMIMLIGATFLLTKISLDTNIFGFELILVLRGASMGLSMMNVMATAMNTIPRIKSSRASSLTNVSRQVVASFSIAVLATVVQSRIALHTSRLLDQVTPGTPKAQLLTELQFYLQTHGYSVLGAAQVAATYIHDFVLQQASVMSFQDAFYITLFPTVGALVLSFFLYEAPHHETAAGDRPVEEALPHLSLDAA